MTVKELNKITKALIAQGSGELDVCINDSDKDMVTSFEARLDTGRYYTWTKEGYEKLSKTFVALTLDV